MSAIQLEQVEATAGRRQSNALRQLDVEVAKSNALATRHPGEPSPSPRHAVQGTCTDYRYVKKLKDRLRDPVL